MADRAVIFDVDGVLVDSYQAHFESWRDLAELSGITFTESQFAETFGRTSRDIIAHFWPGDLDETTIHQMDDRKEALYREIVAVDFPAMDGAAELIDALCVAGFALAVGSSGPPANVLLALDKLGKRELIGATITGRDVTRGKPDPQVFELGAERLGIHPSRCVVIEDAPAGIEAAHRAGMAAIGLASTGRTVDELQQAGATLVLTTLRDLTVERVAAITEQHHSA